MSYRGLIDHKGELFAYLQGDTLFTLDGEATGRLREGYVVDMVGKPIWRVVGDAVYTLSGMEPVGYFGSQTRPDDF